MMGPEMKLNEKPSAEMEVRVGKDNAGGMVPSAEDALMPCVNLYEDRQLFSETCCGDQPKASSGDDVEVTIVDRPLTTFDDGLEEVVREDVTESMSSFDDSGLEIDDGLGDAEVQSQLHPGLDPESAFGGCGTPFGMRKKKLTEDWKSFVHPIMWRCKWIELQLKEFQTQALKYERELAEHEQDKQFEFGTFFAEGFHAKSLPLSCCTHRQQVMKRKKRKRIEETTDLASYISQHTLFSYYEHKNISSSGVALNRTTRDVKTNSNLDVGFEDRWDPIESEGSDNGEEIFRKLEAMQLLVQSWRARVDKIVSEIPEKFSSVSILSSSAPSDPSSSSNPVPSSPLPNEASSHEEGAPLADIFDSIALCRAGENSCENGKEQILMHNQAANEEMRDLRNFGSRPNEEHSSSLENQPRWDLDADLGTRVSYGGKSLPKSRSKVPITKGSRGRKSTVVGSRSKKT